jgi:Tfp pilus assembly protein PilF
VQKYLVTAKELLTVRNCEEARVTVLKAIALDPKKAEAQSLLADIDTVMSQTEQYNEKEVDVERVKTHLSQAQSYIMANMLDKALVEILQGLVLDPDNEELAKLEQRVTTLHEAKISALQSSGHSQQYQKTISKEEQDRLLKIHIRVATEFRTKKDYVQALNEIAHGLVIDPLNTDLLRLDAEARREQAEYDMKASQGLKLIYSGGKATG